MAPMTAPLTISVVMPAYNAAHHMPRVLAPLLAMRDAGEVLEVLVVDDQSTDDTAQIARDLGAHLRGVETGRQELSATAGAIVRLFPTLEPVLGPSPAPRLATSLVTASG